MTGAVRDGLVSAPLPRLVTRLLRSALRAHVGRLRDPDALRDMLFWLQHERLRVDGRLRADAAIWGRLPRLSSHDGAHVLAVSILEGHPPWSRDPAIPCASPSMLTDEERSYYQYIGRF